MPYNYAQLKVGAKNDTKTVKKLQRLLNEKSGAGLSEDGVYGPKTLQAVKTYQRNNRLSPDGIVGVKTWNSLLDGTGEDETPGEAVAAAKKQYEQISAQAPGEFQFADQALYDQAAQAYLNREAFRYDLSADPMYRQYQEQYGNMGRLAMEDAMGKAAALTGGYGNSYAQTAGQQAYGSYLQQLNDRVPELYELAYSKYQDQGDALLARYGLLQDKRAEAYGMYQDTLSRHAEEKQAAYNRYQDALQRQYTQEQDALQRQYTQEQDALDRQLALQKLQYEQSRDALDRQTAQEKWAYQVKQDALQRQDAAFETLKKMIIQNGYVPTGRDLDAAGMTRKQAEAFMKKSASDEE